jgi:hypothetical protein
MSLSGNASHRPVNSLIPNAALPSIRSRKDVLAAWATRVVAIASSRVRNSLIFGSSCFLSTLFFIRAAPIGISPCVSGCACRARVSLRTSWACHWSSCWSSRAPSHK